MADQTSPPPTGMRSSLDGLFALLRGLGLRRNPDDRWLAGVCSGIADRLAIDPLVVRGVLIVLLFVGGIGGLVYLLAWALLPDRDGRILAEDATHGHGWGIVLLVVIGIVIVSDVADRWWLWLVLVPVGMLCWWAVTSARAGRTPEQLSEELKRFADRTVAWGSAPPAGSSSIQPIQPSQPPQPYAGPPSGPHAMGPGRSGTVATPPRVVHRNRRRGGLLSLLLTAGLAVAGYGVGSLVATDRGWAGSPELVAVAFALAGGGLALALVGLSGRRAGLSAALVSILAVPTVLATTLPAPPSGGFGDRAWSAVVQPEGGFSLTAGDATLNLAGVTPGSTVRVVMGAGQLTISVPKGTTATVTAGVRLGQVSLHRMGETTLVQAGVDTAARQPQIVGSGPTAVTVDVTLGAGEVIVTQQS